MFCLLHTSSDPLGSKTAIQYHYTTLGLFFPSFWIRGCFVSLEPKKCRCWHRGSGRTEAGSTAPSCDGWWAFSLLTVSSFWNLSDSALPSSVLKSDYSSFHTTLVPLILMFPFPLSSSVDLPQIYLSIEQYFGTLVSSQEMKESQRKKKCISRIQLAKHRFLPFLSTGIPQVEVT